MTDSTDSAEQVSARDRVRHFLATVEDYRQLETTFPVGNSLNIFGHGDDADSRWKVVLHAMLLRKYFAPRDSLNLKKVVTSLRRCVVAEDYPESEWADLLANVTVIQSGSMIVFNSGGPAWNENQLLEVQLYGRYLHGDFAKWTGTQQAGDAGSDSSVFFATINRAERVKNLADWIGSGIERGSVVV